MMPGSQYKTNNTNRINGILFNKVTFSDYHLFKAIKWNPGYLTYFSEKKYILFKKYVKYFL